MPAFAPAPALHTTTWLNTPAPLSLQRLRGQVVLLHAKRMNSPWYYQKVEKLTFT